PHGQSGQGSGVADALTAAADGLAPTGLVVLTGVAIALGVVSGVASIALRFRVSFGRITSGVLLGRPVLGGLRLLPPRPPRLSRLRPARAGWPPPPPPRWCPRRCPPAPPPSSPPRWAPAPPPWSPPRWAPAPPRSSPPRWAPAPPRSSPPRWAPAPPPWSPPRTAPPRVPQCARGRAGASPWVRVRLGAGCSAGPPGGTRASPGPPGSST